MKYKFLTRIGILAALAICHSVVHASTIAFDDTSNAYDNAWTTTSLTAIQFTATATGVLQQLGLSFTTANGPSALATIQISTDNSGQIGSALQTLNSTVTRTDTNAVINPLTTFTSNGTVTLTAGQRYWVSVTGFAGDWNFVAFDYQPVYLSGTYVTTGTFAPSLQVTVAPVPLPAAAWLMLSGLGGLGALARNRQAS
ncbi:MAG: VPLPA-CTERM sorting domain-containing protein [Verrucomicrobiia bacterium]